MKRPAPKVVSTILTGDSIARSVEALYPVGAVASGHLARRGFNHVYELLLGDGRRCIARLSSLRARGAPNLAYETALLTHLKRSGAAVAAPWPARSGKMHAPLRMAEGTRALAVFDFLPGSPPGESLPDIEAMGAGLASLHRLSEGYRGPASRYQLTLPHLLLQPLQWLLMAPTLDAPMRAAFVALADRLERQIAALPSLSMVACHGDCHGGNSFATVGADGACLASFFDFDEAGPGYLSYDLAAYLWGLQIGTPTALDGAKHERWNHFIGGYRRVGTLPEADFAAVAAFLRVRHFWFMGECASRIHEWGSQALPEAWLRKQIDMLTAWESLGTPPA